jgi:glycopeptide antibiotics resistance protein
VVFQKSVQSVAMNLRLLVPCRYGFFLSILLFFYGTLFPFHFDFSACAWSRIVMIPYWDVERGRIHSLPDMLSNALLTVPLGFFGFIAWSRQKKLRSLAGWFSLGFALGALSETIQLAIPSRMSDITDALNNGFGCFAGAAFAFLFGSRILEFFSGLLFDRKSTYFLILLGIVILNMSLPFDFSMDISRLGFHVRHLWINPWEHGQPIQDEWIQAALFVMLGALAGSIGRPRTIFLAFVLPFILEPMQFLIESHAPSMRDLFMNFAGTTLGVAAARKMPLLVRPAAGFALMNFALLAQGLSPCHFAQRSHFEWIPLVEYYSQTTAAALYDAMSGLLSYGLLATLWPRKTTILWSIFLSGAIEFIQMFLPGRFAGTTDILIASFGAWAGYSIYKASTDLVIQ